jgi:hypothetical protein
MAACKRRYISHPDLATPFERIHHEKLLFGVSLNPHRRFREGSNSAFLLDMFRLRVLRVPEVSSPHRARSLATELYQRGHSPGSKRLSMTSFLVTAMLRLTLVWVISTRLTRDQPSLRGLASHIIPLDHSL